MALCKKYIFEVYIFLHSDITFARYIPLYVLSYSTLKIFLTDCDVITAFEVICHFFLTFIVR